jgi:tetratricopeptide (TPR) repeat protein
MSPAGRFLAKILIIAVCAAALFFKTLPLGAETLDEYYKKGAEKYRTGEFGPATDSWLRGLDEARRKSDKNWTGAFLSSLGISYQTTGDMPRALQYYLEALDYKKEAGDVTGEGQTLYNIACVCRSLQQYEKAVDYYLQSYVIKKKLGDKAGQANCLYNMAEVYTKLNDYTKAAEYFNQSATLKKAVGDTAGESRAFKNLAEIYRNTEQYRKSLDNYRRVLKLTTAAGDRSGEKKLLLTIAELYTDLSDYFKAIYHYNRLLKAASETEDGKAEADAYAGIGNIYKIFKDYPKALYYLDRAVKTYKEGEPARRLAALQAVDIHIERGSMDAARQLLLKFNDPIAMARYHLAKKEYAKARDIMKEFIPRAEKDGQDDVLLAAYTAMGLAGEALEDYAMAFKNFENAFGVAEKIFTSLNEFQKRGFFQKKNLGFARIEPYEGLVRAARHSGLPAAGLYYSEYAKNRLLYAHKNSGDEMNLPSEITETKFSGIPIAPDEVVLAYEVTAPYTRLFIIGHDGIFQVVDITINRAALDDLVKKYVEMLEKSAVGHAKYDPAAGKELYDLLVRPALTGASPPRASGGATPRVSGSVAAFITPSTKLIIVPDETLGLLPFESLVTETADDFAFVSGAKGPVPSGLKYLGDEHDVIYYHSVSSLITQRSFKRGGGILKGGGILAVFAARDKAQSVVESAAETSGSAGRLYRSENSGVYAGRRDPRGQWLLGGAKKEAAAADKSGTDDGHNMLEHIAGKAFKDMTVDVFYGPSLNEESLKNRNLAGYRFLLFSANAVTDDPRAYAGQPALIINEQADSDRQDGVLTLDEVMNLKLNAENVVLLSLKSGRGQNLNGEQVSDIAEAFRRAGARAVLVNLWGAPEEAAAVFLNIFYTRLRTGRTPVEALRAARSQLRETGYGHPAFWSQFILFGE